jgi:hypothetical protein
MHMIRFIGSGSLLLAALAPAGTLAADKASFGKAMTHDGVKPVRAKGIGGKK